MGMTRLEADGHDRECLACARSRYRLEVMHLSVSIDITPPADVSTQLGRRTHDDRRFPYSTGPLVRN